jgi:hypothetical protein
MIVRIKRSRVLCSARPSALLSGSEQGFDDGFVSENDERCHCPQACRKRLVAAGLADPADNLLAAKLLQIISSAAGTILELALFAEWTDLRRQLGGGETVG